MKLFVTSNGCESTVFDSEKVKNSLLQNDTVMLSSKKDADVVVFHSCTFSQQKEDESRDIILNLLKTQSKKIIISGCYLHENVKDERLHFVKNGDLPQFLDSINDLDYATEKESNKRSDIVLLPIVSISRGCYGNCTFCSIKSVKGSHKSRSIDEILMDIELRSFHGYIKLVGEEVAGYGRDLGLNLKTLVDKIVDRFPTLKIKFGSLNVKLLKKYSDTELSIFAYPNVSGNIHIPIQSANNIVLVKMKRGYTIEEYESIYHRLKQLGVRNISADIICGFPGESEKAHQQNIDFIRDHPFAFMEVFAYQERPGTQAAEFQQLDFSIRKKRTLEVIFHFLKSYCTWNNLKDDVLATKTQFFNTNIDLR